MVSFESLWAENDVVFYFLRRFGCPLCRWISNELNSISSVLAENNTKLVGIAPEKFGLEEFQEGKYFTGGFFLFSILIQIFVVLKTFLNNKLSWKASLQNILYLKLHI